MTLREVLHAHIPTLSPTSTVRDAVDKMDVYQFPALVLVDEDEAVLAVITEGDIARAASAAGSIIRMAGEPAINYATRQPRVCEADTEIGDALHLMLMSGLTILPIVDLSRLIGAVLRVDLMQAVMQDLSP